MQRCRRICWRCTSHPNDRVGGHPDRAKPMISKLNAGFIPRGSARAESALRYSPVKMSRGFFVLVTDELDQLGVGVQLLVHSNREGVCVSRWIFNSYVDLQRPVVQPLEPLRQFGLASQWAALDVEPHVVAKPDGLDDQRVAFPVPDRVAVPPGLQ